MAYLSLLKLYYQDKSNYETTYIQRYNSEATQHLSFSIHENPAFLFFTPELFSLLDKITKLDKKLTQITESLPQIAIDQYTKKCLVDEILWTNDIEGIVSTRHEINDTLQNPKEKKRFYGLMQKYLLLLGNKKIPLKRCEDIRNLYDEFILKEVQADDPQDAPDGIYFRKGHVDVRTKTGKIIHEGLFPETAIISMMERSLEFLNDDTHSDLIRIAVFHYLFAYIHPFYDGNGRMTRFISSYLLSGRLHDLTGFRLSYTIKQHLNQYYKSFASTNDTKNKGDLTPFVLNFFGILVHLIEDLCESLKKRSIKLRHYLELVSLHTLPNTDNKDVLEILISNTLFGEQGLSITELMEIEKRSSSTIRNTMYQFQEEGLLKINKEGRRYLYDIDLDKL